MRRIVTLACLAALAACGSAGDDFAAPGNAICADLARKLKGIPKPDFSAKLLLEQSARGRKERAKLQTYNKQVSRNGRRSLRQLRGLEPPARLRAKRDRLFADVDRQIALTRTASRVQSELERAKGAGNQHQLDAEIARAANAARRQYELSRQIDNDFRALGWTTCALRE